MFKILGHPYSSVPNITGQISSRLHARARGGLSAVIVVRYCPLLEKSGTARFLESKLNDPPAGLEVLGVWLVSDYGDDTLQGRVPQSDALYPSFLSLRGLWNRLSEKRACQQPL